MNAHDRQFTARAKTMAKAKSPLECVFGLLEIKAGRVELRKRVEAGEKVQLQINAEIDCVWSNDDGTGQEFLIRIGSLDEPTTKREPMTLRRASPPAQKTKSQGAGLVWGAREIGDVIGRTERQTHHLLTKNEIKSAQKKGGRWCAQVSDLLAEFGRQP